MSRHPDDGGWVGPGSSRPARRARTRTHRGQPHRGLVLSSWWTALGPQGHPGRVTVDRSSAGSCRREPLAVAPYARLPESAEAYRATLPSQFRRNLRSSADRLAAQGVTHRTIRGRAVLRLDILRELHASAVGSRSHFLPVFDRFVCGWGWLRCRSGGRTRIGTDNLVIATVMAFEMAGRVSLYQSARLTDSPLAGCDDRAARPAYRPACVRRFTEVDFLRGDEPYKSRFAPNRREMFRLVAGQRSRGTARLCHEGGDVPHQRRRPGGPVRSLRSGPPLPPGGGLLRTPPWDGSSHQQACFPGASRTIAGSKRLPVAQTSMAPILAVSRMVNALASRGSGAPSAGAS